MKNLFNLPENQPNEVIRALWWNQPYAQLMLHGKIETRNRATKVRGKVLICACKKEYPNKSVMAISGITQTRRMHELLLLHPGRLLGKAIAIGNLVDCKPMTPADEDKCFVAYRPGLWCWIFENVQPIEPFEIKGKQGWAILSEEEKQKIKIIHNH